MHLRFLNVILTGITLFFITGCSVFGYNGVKEPEYTVIETQDAFEIRQYQSMIVASIQVTGDFEEAGDQAFRPLFKYISGDNSSAETIAMTAPVLLDQAQEKNGEKIPMTAPVLAQSKITQAQAEQWQFQFVLPSTMTMDSVPQPTNPDIKIKKIAQKKVAVVTFSGLLNEKNKIKYINVLQQWVEKNNLKSEKNPIIAGYDPPWTLPFLRRNEIQIEVE